MRSYRTCVAVTLLLAMTFSACGKSNAPDEALGQVTGIVTLDDQPLEGANITFTPILNGAMSYGTTDAQGKYELIYSPGIKGAVLGEHQVRISKVGGPETKFDTMEMLPADYNSKTTIKAVVQSGKNSFNYDLKSTAAKKK